MSDKLKIEMQIMQDNLSDLRKIAGWTAEVLAGKLGITKQTISNIENQKVKISTIQYIAIRSVLECEIASNQSNTTLRKVMGVLFQAMPPIYTSRREDIRAAMISIASISAAGLSGLQLHSSATALLAPLGSAAVQMSNTHTGEPSLKWLQWHLNSSESDDFKDTEVTEEETDENN